MSDTPRVDGAAFGVRQYEGDFGIVRVVRYEFAQELERRLIASQAECERLLQEHETLRVNIDALVAGPMMYHHKMDASDIRAAEAFDRCRELTLANFATHFALSDAIRAAMQSEQGEQG